MTLSRIFYGGLFLSLILAVAVFLVWHVSASENQPSLLTVAFLDVGEGAAVYVQTPDGTQVLVDGGADAGVLRALGKLMPFYDRSFDAVVVSGYDSGRIGGLFSVLGAYHVGEAIEPGGLPTSATGKALKAVLAQKNIPEVAAQRGMKIALDKGDGSGGKSDGKNGGKNSGKNSGENVPAGSADVFLEILFPAHDMSTLPLSAANAAENSLVIRLVYKNTSVLLASDIPVKIQNYLVQLDGGAANLKSDILAVPHYGSATSTSVAFLQAVLPQYAVISAAANNRYSYPAQKLLDELGAAGIPAGQIFATLGKGSLLFQSDGEKWTNKRI